MNLRKSLFCFLSLLFCISCTITQKKDYAQNQPSEKDAFVRVEDGRFVRNQKDCRFVGTNFWYGAILASTGQGGDRARLVQELNLLKSCGIDNLRIMVGADGVRGVASKVEPTLHVSPTEYNDTILDGLDYLLYEMSKRDMMAVLYLNNSWEWSGGYGQYLEWAGLGKAPIPSVDGWPAYMEFVRKYAQCEPAQKIFEDYVRFIVGRTNRYTQVAYVDDPTIFSWQIGNEPRAFSDENKPAFERWMARTSALIKSLDSNHMVSTGSEGIHGCEDDYNVFKAIHTDPNIDYINIHIWPYNWGWLTPDKMDAQLASIKDSTYNYILSHASVSQALKKPIVLEEFGFPRQGLQFGKEMPTTGRDAYFDYIFSIIFDQQTDRPLIAGCNFWAWGGLANPKHVYWQVGDDYTGDPAQEQQGLNSVFASDTSTLNVIRKWTQMNKQMSARSPQDNAQSAHSPEAATLLNRMAALVTRGIMFGHHDDTVYGIGWNGDANRSDVKSVCGDYPAVVSYDLGHIELGDSVNLDGVPFSRIRQAIIRHYEQGGIATLSWHLNNPVTGLDSWDTSDSTVVRSVLPGGTEYQKFQGWLARVAAFMQTIKTPDGTLIPILFRPWHEHTGSWFWWGQKLCGADEYKQLWTMTANYLRDRGLHNLLFAYSPGIEPRDTSEYLERYPGDSIIDLLGFDGYRFNEAQYDEAMRRMLPILQSVGQSHHKLIALTETGFERVPQADWWTNSLWPLIQDYPLSYVLVWRNAHTGHFYAPYPGQESAADFVQFYKQPKTLFLHDVQNIK